MAGVRQYTYIYIQTWQWKAHTNTRWWPRYSEYQTCSVSPTEGTQLNFDWAREKKQSAEKKKPKRKQSWIHLEWYSIQLICVRSNFPSAGQHLLCADCFVSLISLFAALSAASDLDRTQCCSFLVLWYDDDDDARPSDTSPTLNGNNLPAHIIEYFTQFKWN